jgi:uncharacterized protein YyaL (SSP411 family)
MRSTILFLLAIGFSTGSLAQTTRQQYIERIGVIRQNIEIFFGDASTGYYRETNPLKQGEKPFSHLWPLCGYIQAANEWEALSGQTALFDSVLAAIQPYYDSASIPAYGAYIVREKRDDRFYDDNQWIAIACLDAYERTHRKQYFEQGLMIYRFMMSGYDTVAGGGLYWKEKDPSTKNTCSNGPGVLVALQLYKATGKKIYLDTALMLYNWTKANLLSPGKLYYDNIQLPSRKTDKRTYTYNTGTMLQGSVMLYQFTRQKKYLQHARELAKASLQEFFRNNSFPDHYWFNAVLLRGYLELYKIDRNKTYLDAFRKYGEHIWEKERDRANQLIGKSNVKELLDQAAVMEIYARLAMVTSR